MLVVLPIFFDTLSAPCSMSAGFSAKSPQKRQDSSASRGYSVGSKTQLSAVPALWAKPVPRPPIASEDEEEDEEEEEEDDAPPPPIPPKPTGISAKDNSDA